MGVRVDAAGEAGAVVAECHMVPRFGVPSGTAATMIPPRKPPPLPPRFPSEPPTVPTRKEFRAALLVKYWGECDPSDQDYLIQLAEKLSARNANKD